MNEIMETLIRLAPGRYNMEEVAAASREKRDAVEVGRLVASLDGRIERGVRVELNRTGRMVFVLLHNV
jgi:hypothetical protein